MHMADALISPAVVGTMWVATAGLISGIWTHCHQEIQVCIRLIRGQN
jgi:hypothetical protein